MIQVGCLRGACGAHPGVTYPLQDWVSVCGDLQAVRIVHCCVDDVAVADAVVDGGDVGGVGVAGVGCHLPGLDCVGLGQRDLEEDLGVTFDPVTNWGCEIEGASWVIHPLVNLAFPQTIACLMGELSPVLPSSSSCTLTSGFETKF